MLFLSVTVAEMEGTWGCLTKDVVGGMGMNQKARKGLPLSQPLAVRHQEFLGQDYGSSNQVGNVIAVILQR